MEYQWYLGFSYCHKIGPARFARLKSYFSSLEAAWSADSEELRCAGLDDDALQQLLRVRSSLDLASETARLTEQGISLIPECDESYPVLLREISSPPFLLYVRGVLPPSDAASIGVVGTRKATEYGRCITPQLCQSLARQGVVIVSGLALGIDALAHSATLAVDGQTVAVVGCGVDGATLYPASNRVLADEIVAKGGAVISEYPPGTQPLKHFFPLRNRIIAGISSGVLVIEADVRSGSLITAQCALDFGREVFAVPGAITHDASVGPNNLIKAGAHVVTTADDIFEVLNWEQMKKAAPEVAVVRHGATQEEELLLQIISSEPIHIDDLIARTRLEAARISSALLVLEMKGWVRHLGAMRYARID